MKKSAKIENKLMKGESNLGENLGEPRSFLDPPNFIKGVKNFDFEGPIFNEAKNFGHKV